MSGQARGLGFSLERRKRERHLGMGRYLFDHAELTDEITVARHFRAIGISVTRSTPTASIATRAARAFRRA